jgi:hypothetical protein
VSSVFAKSQHLSKFLHHSSLACILRVQKRSALMLSMNSAVDQIPASPRLLRTHGWLGHEQGTKTRSEWMCLWNGAELSSVVHTQCYLPATVVDEQRRLWSRLNAHRSGQKAEEGVGELPKRAYWHVLDAKSWTERRRCAAFAVCLVGCNMPRPKLTDSNPNTTITSTSVERDTNAFFFFPCPIQFKTYDHHHYERLVWSPKSTRLDQPKPTYTRHLWDLMSTKWYQ